MIGVFFDITTFLNGISLTNLRVRVATRKNLNVKSRPSPSFDGEEWESGFLTEARGRIEVSGIIKDSLQAKTFEATWDFGKTKSSSRLKIRERN